MRLFTNDNPINLLSLDGTAIYFGEVLPQKEADRYFDQLFNTIQWKNDETIIFGKHIITKRKVAWYGDSGFSYTYSSIARHALSWTNDLIDLKKLAEKTTGETYNSCLLNLYHNGNEGMSWHRDNENTLVRDAAIASFSFGAERKFSFRHNGTKQTISVMLGHGSILLMKDGIQQHWLHSLPKSTLIKKPRINLTFRKMTQRKTISQF